MKRVAIVLASCLSWPRVAPAEPACPPDPDRAKLYDEGKAAADREQWEEAAAKFRQVVSWCWSPGALLALAIAEERLGKAAVSARLLRRCSKDADGDDRLQDRLACEQALSLVEPRVGVLVLTTNKTAGIQITVDGAPVGPGDFDVEPGEHIVAAQAPGRLPFRRSLAVAKGSRTPVPIALLVDPSTAPPATVRRAAPVGAIVLGSAGVVFTGISIGLLMHGRAMERDIVAECDPGSELGGSATGCPPTRIDDAHAARRQIIAGDVLVGLGSAAIASSALWWALAGRLSDSRRADAQAGVVPMVGGALVFLGARY